MESLQKAMQVLAWTVVFFIISSIGLYYVGYDLSDIFHKSIDSTSFFVEFAPEIWLTLLSVVLGTLIIVISIASQSNPKLIDYYIQDQPSLVYTSFITVAAIENIIIQLDLTNHSLFYNNIIFVNSFVLLPLALFLILPYAIYILSYTKTSSLIFAIQSANRKAIGEAIGKKVKSVEKVHYRILNTLNQLDDQHGYVQFKEPKSEIINTIGDLTIYYLSNKNRMDENIFRLTDVVKKDNTFKTLSDEFTSIGNNRTFLETKVFRIYSGFYLKLMNSFSHDLASQCCHEVYRISKVAYENGDRKVLELAMFQFNTFLRLGIKYAIQHKDIRHIFNCIYHYTQTLLFLVSQRDTEFLIKGCQFLTFYGNEIYTNSLYERQFIFMIDAMASKIQKVLIETNKAEYDFQTQIMILRIYASLEPDIDKEYIDRIRNNKSRTIKIALILYYIHKKENEFVAQLISDIIDDLRYFSEKEILKIVESDCLFLKSVQSQFWEHTDQGDLNIYYTPYRRYLKIFVVVFRKQLRKSRIEKVK